MKFPINFFQQRKLLTRLSIWFSLISLIPLIWMSFISYDFSKKMLLNQATENLQALSQRQVQVIETYFQEKERNAVSLVKGILIPLALEKLSQALTIFGKNSPEYKAADEQFRPTLEFRTEMLGYSNLYLLTKEGELVFSMLPTHLLGTNLFKENQNQLVVLQKLFDQVKRFLQPQISNFNYSDLSEDPICFIAVPLLDDNIFVGVAVVQIDNSAIYKFTSNYSGLGKTGETIIVTEIDGRLISVTPLRHEQEQEVITLNTPFSQFIEQILEGKRLTDIVVDYRGKETLMSGRSFLPSLQWGIITKKDMDELLAPISKLEWFSLAMVINMAAIILLIASIAARSLADPILMLTKKTNLMAAGDLSQRIEIQAHNEVGVLAQSFNAMACRMNNMVKHLDSLVADRTKQIEAQNAQLEVTIKELKETQNRLVNQEKLASLGALTAGIAHEIKNPLNFINNFAELSLQIDTEMEERLEKIKAQISSEEAALLHEYLETLKLNISKIYDHGRRADSIVHNMLQHSRGAPGEKHLININALLDEYLSLSYHGMRAQNLNFNVKIEKEYDQTLPLIPAVAQEMSRVFLNILNNAYYSLNQKEAQINDASYTPLIKISTQRSGYSVVIRFWDNGLGISEEVSAKLFTPFFTTKPSGEGTGLGLSLSYNIIVQGHQGTLSFNSKAGEFAEFIIVLPIELP